MHKRNWLIDVLIGDLWRDLLIDALSDITELRDALFKMRLNQDLTI